MNSEVAPKNKKQNEKNNKQSNSNVQKKETICKQIKVKSTKIKLDNNKLYVPVAKANDDDGANIYVQTSTNQTSELLLSYIYFLNDEKTKYVTVGFHVENFLPYASLYNITNSYINFDELQWMDLMIKKNEINNFFNQNQETVDTVEVNISNNIQIYLGNNAFNEKIIIVSHNANSILFSYSEWNKLSLLLEFINMIMMWYKTGSQQVKSYFQQYVNLCKEKNVVNLEASDFFYVPQSNMKINFIRLFHEIPVICKTKLYTELLYN